MPIEITSEGEIITTKENSSRASGLTEIVSRKPSFFVQWGSLIFMTILLILILFSFLISYPEVVQSSGKLVAINSPKPVMSNSSGRILKIFAKENDYVKRSQVLGILESNANYISILKLNQIVDSINILRLSKRITKTNIRQFQKEIESSEYGELQKEARLFIEFLISYVNFLENGFHDQKIKLLIDQKEDLISQNLSMLEQRTIYKEDLELAKANFKANTKLVNDKVISLFDFRNERSKLLNKMSTIPEINNAIIANHSAQTEIVKEIFQISSLISEQNSRLEQEILSMKNAIEEWKKRFFLLAPIDGIIHYPTFVEENEFININQKVFFISPSNTTFYIRSHVPQANFGKLHIGQKVLFKMYSYPSEEFGPIQGNIQFISKVALDSGFVIKVSVDTLSAQKRVDKIAFMDGLEGQLDIITQDMSLVSRIYNSVFNR